MIKVTVVTDGCQQNLLGVTLLLAYLCGIQGRVTAVTPYIRKKLNKGICKTNGAIQTILGGNCCHRCHLFGDLAYLCGFLMTSGDTGVTASIRKPVYVSPFGEYLLLCNRKERFVTCHRP